MTWMPDGVLLHVRCDACHETYAGTRERVLAWAEAHYMPTVRGLVIELDGITTEWRALDD